MMACPQSLAQTVSSTRLYCLARAHLVMVKAHHKFQLKHSAHQTKVTAAALRHFLRAKHGYFIRLDLSSLAQALQGLRQLRQNLQQQLTEIVKLSAKTFRWHSLSQTGNPS